MSSQNVAILAQIAFLITLFREPVLLVGDFNMAMSELQTWVTENDISPFAQRMSLQLHLLEAGALTMFLSPRVLNS